MDAATDVNWKCRMVGAGPLDPSDDWLHGGSRVGGGEDLSTLHPADRGSRQLAKGMASGRVGCLAPLRSER